MLYSIYNDSKKYAYLGFDWKQIVNVFGESPATRFDANWTPRSYSGIWVEPIRIMFDDCEGMVGTAIPDIAEHHGRLFLSESAYTILRPLISDVGEFLPVEHENGKGYMFNPLRLAEEVDGLDEKLCVKNEWGEVENIAFDEARVKPFNIFKTKYDNFYSVYCQQAVKDAVEDAGLKGVVFTPDLGNYLGVADFMKN